MTKYEYTLLFYKNNFIRHEAEIWSKNKNMQEQTEAQLYF